MKLDYQLTHLINNYKVNRSAKYWYVGSTIWFSKQELCDEVGNYLGVNIPIETKISVTKKQMENIYKLFIRNKNFVGTYGNDFLNEWI